MIISLSSSQWQVRGYWPHTPLFGRSMETGVEMGACTRWMAATVPGCVLADLVSNGAVEDPYYEANSLKCEWVENRWWVYRTEFTLEKAWEGRDIALVFLGVDYRCHIFLNGEKLCEHEGMFEPIRLDISQKALFGGKNRLEVVLESAPDEMGQIGRTSLVRTQKSRFGYKWDFSTRLVHTGIWDDVYLDVTGGARIETTHVATSLEGNSGVVNVSARLKLSSGKSYRLSAVLRFAGAVVAEQTAETESQNITLSLRVRDPLIWWPNGFGGQPLYDLSITLHDGDAVCDAYDCRAGIRSLGYERNEGAADSLPYVLKINGTRIYLKGMNMTPLDHMIGSVAQARYVQMLGLARDANVNLIRVWGGGIIEKDAFYRLCDEYGILIWQEFNQSSSGIDNVPPKDVGYLDLLRRNATAAVLGRRNHVSLAYWSGGNELMDFDSVPVSYADENIAMLKSIVDELDPQRLFLPTSASGPSEFLNVTPEGRGRNHDVHGPWQYQGVQTHYEMFNTSDSLLHSEFGVDGFTNPSAVVRFLSEENRQPSTVNDNPIWRHHGEWWDTTERDRQLFGTLSSLDGMIACSQFIQAEGLRYAVEANRRRSFQNCGSIIWQFNEPWPNLFCTSLVDYYGQPKAAYWWVKRAYEPLHVSLRHGGLVVEPGGRFRAEAWISDDACSYEGPVAWRVLDMAGQVHVSGSFVARCGGRHSVRAGEIEFDADGFPCGFFIIELAMDGAESANHYLFSCNREPSFAGLLAECACPRVDVAVAEGGRCVAIENRSGMAALFVRLADRSSCDVFRSNGFTLFPGQRERVECSVPVSAEDVSIDWLNRSRAGVVE